MVEPRRRCYSLPSVELRKKVVGGRIYVTVISASKLSRSCLRGNSSRRQQSSFTNGTSEEQLVFKDLQTFAEVELEELTRRTDVGSGSSPTWNSTFNMVLHEETGTIRFHLYECTPSNVKYDYLASCEIKVLLYLMLILSEIINPWTISIHLMIWLVSALENAF